MPRARPIVLAAVLGVFTALASAWALAAWMPFDPLAPAPPRGTRGHVLAGGRPWGLATRLAPGSRLIWWSTLDAASMGTPEERHARAWPTTAQGWVDLACEEGRASGSPLVHDDSPPSWGTFAGGGAPPPTAAHGADHGFGWPLPALWYRVDGVIASHTATATGIHGGLLLTPEHTLSVRGSGFRALPLLPAWRGLLVNSLLFAAFFWFLFTAPRVLRRALRARAGRCRKCAYDLRGLAAGSPCPECGVPSRSASEPRP